MRIWDISPDKLCRQHLLGEHRELHALWSILTTEKKGYRHHPETLRWKGKLKALYGRHAEQVKEMQRRGYQHQSPLDPRYATGQSRQDTHVDSTFQQAIILRKKKCGCQI